MPFAKNNFVKNKKQTYTTKTLLYLNCLVSKKNYQTSLIFYNSQNINQVLQKKKTFSQINFSPVFHKRFIRNVYFFLYFVKKSKTWVDNFQNKIKHFKLEYTFVNTTHLKKYVVRRFSREMFFSKFGLSLDSAMSNNRFSYKNPKRFFSKTQVFNHYPIFL